MNHNFFMLLCFVVGILNILSIFRGGTWWQFGGGCVALAIWAGLTFPIFNKYILSWIARLYNKTLPKHRK